MKQVSKLGLIGLVLVVTAVAGCTLSTTGLRAPADHSLAYGAITEVYDEPEAAPAP